MVNIYQIRPEEKHFFEYYKRQAYKNKKWANTIAQTPEWQKGACIYSLETAHKYRTKPIIQMAKESFAYEKMRAYAQEGRYIIDPSARRFYEKKTGKKIRFKRF